MLEGPLKIYLPLLGWKLGESRLTPVVFNLSGVWLRWKLGGFDHWAMAGKRSSRLRVPQELLPPGGPPGL